MSVKKYYWIRGCLSICLSFMLCSCNTDNGQKLLKEITLLRSKPIDYCQNKLVYDNVLQERINI